jgi:hypothetical protein
MVGTLWPRIHAVLFAYCRLLSLVLYWRSQDLGELIPEQFLNILRKGDGDQSPAPLQ